MLAIESARSPSVREGTRGPPAVTAHRTHRRQPPCAPETDVAAPGGSRRAVGLVVPAGALVAVQNTAMSTITDEQGRFTLAGAPASLVITIHAVKRWDKRHDCRGLPAEATGPELTLTADGCQLSEADRARRLVREAADVSGRGRSPLAEPRQQVVEPFRLDRDQQPA